MCVFLVAFFYARTVECTAVGEKCRKVCASEVHASREDLDEKKERQDTNSSSTQRHDLMLIMVMKRIYIEYVTYPLENRSYDFLLEIMVYTKIPNIYALY